MDLLRPLRGTAAATRGRYYISDNFLVAWLAALKPSVDAINFRPVDQLVQRADERLRKAEGFALEKLVAKLYEERSRKGLPGAAPRAGGAGIRSAGSAGLD